MKTYVYIAGPYTRGDCVQNVRRAILVADRLATQGFVPFIPHLSHFWHFLCPHEIQFWYDLDLAWLRKCDCLLRLSGDSMGANLEVTVAREHGIPVYWTVPELLEGEARAEEAT